MSHLHERKEKVCLNCGASLIGRYCQDCGQENVEPKESAWHLIVHFFNDITHFDGKFFNTMKLLLTRPGFLSEEYMKGRRAKYINPIRMYLFVSAVFFLMLMSFFSGKSNVIEIKDGTKRDTSATKKALLTASKVAMDLDTIEFEGEKQRILLKNGDTVTRRQIDDYEPKTIKSFDSFQALLPPAEKMSKTGQYFARKMILAEERRKKDRDGYVRELWAKYYHSLPYMLFLALPVIALFFRIAYVRRKDYNYVSHAIFVIHFTCVVFITLLIDNILEAIGGWANYIGVVLNLSLAIYLYLAMRRFYKQGGLKTFIKFFLLSGFSLTFVLLLAFVILVNSAIGFI